MEGGDEIEEGSRGSSDSRWVDGSEVDLLQWGRVGEEESGKGESGPGLRRRLGKKPKRVDSFDVEAMSVPASHGHHDKVCASDSFFYLFCGFWTGKIESCIFLIGVET